MRAQSGGRVLTASPIPLGDVSRAIGEIEHAYHELGIRAFWARPNFLNRRNLGSRYYDPIYELLQDPDVPFATHEFMGVNATSEGADRFDTFTEWHTTVHAHEAMNACLSMIVQGVFERFPRLRCSYMEAGCGWLDGLDPRGFAGIPPDTQTNVVTFMTRADPNEVPRRFYHLTRQIAVELYYAHPAAIAGYPLATAPQPAGYPPPWT